MSDDFLEVVFEFVVIDAAGLGEPGEDIPLLGVHHEVELLVGKGIVADKVDGVHALLAAFRDIEDDVIVGTIGRALSAPVNLGVRITGLLVGLENLGASLSQ